MYSHLSLHQELCLQHFYNYPHDKSSQAVTHSSPFLQQEQEFVPHRFLDDSLHLHRTNFNRFSRAAGRSVITGINLLSESFQPHCSRLNCTASCRSSFHRIICKCTSRLWIYAALSVGGSFCGSIALPIDTISKNLANRKKFNDFSCLPPKTISNRRTPAFPMSTFKVSGLLICSEIYCTSSDERIFLTKVIFPMSQPVQAWINNRWVVDDFPAFEIKSLIFQTCKPFFWDFLAQT